MFELVMVLCFAYAGFCCLLPEEGSVEEGEDEGSVRMRREAAQRAVRRRSLGRPVVTEGGALSLLWCAARAGEGNGYDATGHCRRRSRR